MAEQLELVGPYVVSATAARTGTLRAIVGQTQGLTRTIWSRRKAVASSSSRHPPLSASDISVSLVVTEMADNPETLAGGPETTLALIESAGAEITTLNELTTQLASTIEGLVLDHVELDRLVAALDAQQSIDSAAIDEAIDSTPLVAPASRARFKIWIRSAGAGRMAGGICYSRQWRDERESHFKRSIVLIALAGTQWLPVIN